MKIVQKTCKTNYVIASKSDQKINVHFFLDATAFHANSISFELCIEWLDFICMLLLVRNVEI